MLDRIALPGNKGIRRTTVGLVVVLATALAGCDTASTTPDEGLCPIFREAASTQASGKASRTGRDGTWVDLGVVSQATDVRGLVVVDGTMLLATNDGVWRRPLDGTGEWTRSGLAGRHVLSLAAAPEAGLVFAGTAPLAPEEAQSMSASDEAGTFFVSEDGGVSWTARAEGLFDPALDAYDPVEYLSVVPGTNGRRLFAGLAASTIAHSDDGGTTWRVVSGQLGGFGYPCPVHVAHGDPNTVFQGCEAPLDIAWIRAYDASASELDELGEGCQIVGHDQISNRRPNVLTSFPDYPGYLYAGLEGALIVIHADGWEWIWARDPSGETNYTYVTFVWVDPEDPDHIVFGGGDGDGQENTRAGLYETFDRGETVVPLDGPEGVDFTVGGVRAGTPVNGGRDFVVAHLSESGVRVLMRTY